MPSLQQDVVLVTHGQVGELVLHRPKRRNALTPDLAAQMLAGLQELLSDDETRVVLIRGSGDYLCSGLDLKVMSAYRKEGRRNTFAQSWRAFHTLMFKSRCPTVCALQGGAIAGGSGLALACDFIIAAEDATFHVAEAKFGMAAPMNTVWAVLRHGRAKALDLVVGAQAHRGSELVALGVAKRAVPSADVLAAARQWAATVAKNDPTAVALLRRSVLGDFDFETQLDRLYREAAAGKPPPSSVARASSARL